MFNGTRLDAFGWGFLLGSLLFDQLWRYIRRLEKRLAEARTKNTPDSQGGGA